MSDRFALVTGANRGIGLETTRQLVAAGFTVFLGARDRGKARSAASDIDPAQKRAIPVSLDVASDASVREAASEIASRCEHLDVLVNNAAILYDSGVYGTSADLAIVHEALETNLFGAWRTTLALLPLLRKSKHARIVNVSSEAGSIAEMGPGTPAYSVSKAALNACTRIIAAELAPQHILVNAISPGWTATDMGGGGRPVREGAASVVWGALLPDDGPTGGFFRDGRPLRW
jgi:NAD(P)-dependent dehydrogenase (short-subunit alcohol dehydrogenase family)